MTAREFVPYVKWIAVGLAFALAFADRLFVWVALGLLALIVLATLWEMRLELRELRRLERMRRRAWSGIPGARRPPPRGDRP